LTEVLFRSFLGKPGKGEKRRREEKRRKEGEPKTKFSTSDANTEKLGAYFFLTEVLFKSFWGEPEEPELSLAALKIFCLAVKSQLPQG
jgi:hypothetical protein